MGRHGQLHEDDRERGTSSSSRSPCLPAAKRPIRQPIADRRRRKIADLVLRGAGRRQPRPRPAAQRRDHLRSEDPPRHQRCLPHRDRPPGQRRRPGQRLLQPLPDQAIPQRRQRYAHRDRHGAPRDLGCKARLHNLDDPRPRPAPATGGSWRLNASARAPSSRVQPSSGSRTLPWTRPGGRPRPCASAILGSWPWPAPLRTLLAATGFTNKSLRALIAGLLGSDYPPGQMTYDLRRLRLAGLSTASRTATATPSPTTASASPSSTPSLQPAARPAHRRQPAPSPTRAPRRAGHHHPPRRRLHHPSPPHPSQKLDSDVQNPATKEP